MKKKITTGTDKDSVKKILTRTAKQLPTHDDKDYELFLSQIRERFIQIVSRTKNLFITYQENLFDVFLANLPTRVRQHYNCNACRHFVNKFGGIVIISPNGESIPLMWNLDFIPPLYKKSVTACYNVVKDSQIASVFVCKEKEWGTSVTGIWHHMAVKPPNDIIFYHPLQSENQYMTEKSSDFEILTDSLRKYPLPIARNAVELLLTNSMFRSEKIIGVAQWFYNLHVKRSKLSNKAKKNITWLAVATAPAGFCHIRSSMIGTLLEDLSNELPFVEVKRKFEEKMNPTQYQRPQVNPDKGNVKVAEKIIQNLESEGSFERRFAKLDEVLKMWLPQPKNHIESFASIGLFHNVPIKNVSLPSPLMDMGHKTLTWEKFARTVLPEAVRLEFLIPHEGNYSAIVTAVNFNSPPIIAWDNENRRNPFSWYVYEKGSPSEQWGLVVGRYCKVLAICPQPSMWYGNYPQHGQSVTFILEGARDFENASLALFPEILKSEYHSVRATIEAYSHSRRLKVPSGQLACGVRMQKIQDGVNFNWDYKFRVTTGTYTCIIDIDRWD